MRAADEEVKRRAEADAKRQIEASRVAAANEVAAAPVRVFSFVVFSPTVCPYIHTEPVFINSTHNSQGFPAAFNAAAVAAIASGDASKVHVILRIVRAPGTPAFARALPGGAKTWSDPAVWIGLDRFYNSRLVDSRMGDEADDISNSGNGAPYIGSRRDLAWRMASVGLPPHAIGGILARLPVHDDSESSLPGEPTRQMDIQTLNSIQKDPPTGKQGSNTSEDVNNRGNGNNDANNTGLPPRVAPVPVASADRVGRSVGRVWEVSKSVNNNNDADANIDDDQIAKSGGGTGTHFGDDDDAITRIRQSGTSSGAGAAIVHDAWIERMRLAARASSDPAGGKKKRFKNGSSIGSADSSSIPDDAENTAPWWALPTGATGIGGKSPFSLDAHCGRSVKSLGFAKRRNNSVSVFGSLTVFPYILTWCFTHHRAPSIAREPWTPLIRSRRWRITSWAWTSTGMRTTRMGMEPATGKLIPTRVTSEPAIKTARIPLRPTGAACPPTFTSRRRGRTSRWLAGTRAVTLLARENNPRIVPQTPITMKGPLKVPYEVPTTPSPPWRVR